MKHSKIVTIVQRLADKTKNGELAWVSTERPAVFQTSLANATIRIRGPRAGFVTVVPLQIEKPADYLVQIFNENAELIEETDELELRESWPESGEMLKELYENARRSALGVEKTLDQILAELEHD